MAAGKELTQTGKALITGGAGFVGSNLVDYLLENGWEVIAYDNLSTGNPKFLEKAQAHPKFKFVREDVLEKGALTKAMQGCDWVFHFSANADIRGGLDQTFKDIEQNTIGTYNVLEAMRANKITRIGFSSTSAIYGEATVFPTPEDCPLPTQTSLYGASKLAAEGLITSYTEGFGFEANIFRFASVMGPRYSHGHAFDFYKKLKANPARLEILGDGKQKKSYFDVSDCVRGVMMACLQGNAAGKKHRVGIYNLGTEDYCEVTNSARWIADEMGLKPEFIYTGGRQGWVGDNPFVFLATDRIRSLGWKTQKTTEEAVRSTVRWLKANEWALERK